MSSSSKFGSHFSESISDVNIDNPVKFRYICMLKNCITKNWVFSGFSEICQFVF